MLDGVDTSLKRIGDPLFALRMGRGVFTAIVRFIHCGLHFLRAELNVFGLNTRRDDPPLSPPP